MGTGKSFWGKKWAAHLNYQFIDMDDEIAKKEGQHINTIFSEKGEAYFRKIETDFLRKIEGEKKIIACGGGTPCINNNMQWMNANGITVYLRKSPAELYDNLIQEKFQRPLLQSLNDHEILPFIEQKLKEREPFYKQAAVTLQSDQIHINSLDTIKHA